MWLSVFISFKTNHNGVYTNPEKWKRNGGYVTDYDLGRFTFIESTNADFPTNSEKYYRFLPYDNWTGLAHRKFDFVIRFENLQDDFAKVLKFLDIEQKRPLPVTNKTGGRGDDFWSYYTPESWDQARKVFAPYLRKWGYDFPPEWGDSSVPWSSQALLHVLGLLRRRLQWGSSFDARLFKRLWPLR